MACIPYTPIDSTNSVNISLAYHKRPPLSYRGALYRRMRDFNAAVDDFLLAMDKCGHRQDCAVYVHASRQLVLTYNDFAVECFQ